MSEKQPNNPEILINPEHKEIPLNAYSALEALPTVSCISFLIESGVSQEDLKTGFQLSGQLSKLETSVLDYLVATGTLLEDLNDTYILSPEHQLSNQDISKLQNLKTSLKKFSKLTHPKSDSNTQEVITFLASIDQDLTSFEKATYLTPLLGYLLRESSHQNQEPTEYLNQLLDQDQSQVLADYLRSVNFLDEQNQFTPLANRLFISQPLPGFIHLSQSYTDYYLHLYEIQQNPQLCGYKKKYDRWQPDNALASNRLIKNSAPKISKALTDFQVIIDFGSGGGHFLHELVETTHRLIGFDLSTDANLEAEALFAQSGNDQKLTTIHGNLLSAPDLFNAAKHNPDAATINYILHDIAGIATRREDGIAIVKNFLENFRHFFPNTPLLISESYDASRQVQKQDHNSQAAIFHLIHGISPQFLLGRQELIGLLREVGFSVDEEEEIVNRFHKNGEIANSTIVAR